MITEAKLNILFHHDGVPGDLQDFVLICGGVTDPSSFRNMIEEIQAEVLPNPPQVVVIAPCAMEEEEKLEEIKHWGQVFNFRNDVFVVFGSVFDENTLKRAGVEKARIALVLAEPKLPKEEEKQFRIGSRSSIEANLRKVELADEVTSMIVWTLKAYWLRFQKGGKVKRVPHMGVELASTDHRRNLVRLGVEDIVSTDAIEEKLLAHASLAPGISYFLVELVTPTKNSTEIYREKLPSNFDQKTFQEVVGAFVKLGRIPIGLVRKEEEAKQGKEEEYAVADHKVILQPDRLEVVSAERDEVFVIGYSPLTEEEKNSLTIPENFQLTKWKVRMKRFSRWITRPRTLLVLILVAAAIWAGLNYELVGTKVKEVLIKWQVID